MASAIAKVYARSCEKGTKNFNDVPENIQEEVREIILKDGYIINKDGTVEPKPINDTEEE